MNKKKNEKKQEQENKILELTLKYFAQRKLLEIVGFVGAVFIPYYLGKWITKFPIEPKTWVYNLFFNWIIGAFIIFGAVWLTIGLIHLVKDNWKKAKARAIKEVQKRE